MKGSEREFRQGIVMDSGLEARFVRVPGALNFRDLGGYPTIDRRHTRWNALFRSGTTHTILPEDLPQLSKYGIRFVYDLRSATERSAHPSGFCNLGDIRYGYFEHNVILGDVARTLHQSASTPEESRAGMISAYRKMPLLFRDAFRALFRHLEDGDLPLVFNCAAGKDRTGVAAALVLSALGVPRDVVLDDYLLTERCYDQSCEILIQGKAPNLFAAASRNSWEPIMRADPAYLNAMFEELALNYGSVDQYLREELGISEASYSRLRSNLLE
jgi:protein-tyrosine phosphatase